MPVGLVPAPVMVQEPWSVPARLYLNTLSVLESLTTQRDDPSVTMSLGLELPLLRLKLLAAFWLPDSRLAAPVYLKPLSWRSSTIQMSVPLVAIPSTVTLEARLPAVQEPSRAPAES